MSHPALKAFVHPRIFDDRAKKKKKEVITHDSSPSHILCHLMSPDIYSAQALLDVRGKDTMNDPTKQTWRPTSHTNEDT